MEWNDLLLYLAGFSAFMTLVGTFRNRTRQWGWVAVCCVILVALGVTYCLRPEIAGYVGGSIWVVFMLVPTLIYRQVQKRVVSQRFAAAAGMLSVARFLHPFDGWWHMADLYRALEMADRGENEQALAMLRPLSARGGMIGLAAKLNFCKITRDWLGAIALTQETARTKNMLLANQAIPMFIRALGELGQVDAMIHVYEQCRATFEAATFVILRANARWMLFTYAGRPAAVRDLLEHQFTGMPPHRVWFWVARAEWAAGQTEQAAATMQELARSTDRGIAEAAQYVLDHPPRVVNISFAGEPAMANVATTQGSTTNSPAAREANPPTEALAANRSAVSDQRAASAVVPADEAAVLANLASAAGENPTAASPPSLNPSRPIDAGPLIAPPAIAGAPPVLEYAPVGSGISLAGQAALDRAEQDAHHDRQYAVMPLGYRQWAVVTYVIVAMNVVMFFIEIAEGGSTNDAALDQLGAAFRDGAWWRIIAANFLHFGVAHISMNMLGLIALGPFVERFVGRVKYAIIYAVSGIGAVGGVVMAQRLGWMAPESLVGASGAIMGLIGATTAILLRGWLTDGAGVAKRRFRVLLVIVAMQVVFDNITPQVSGTAHLIGLAIGFVATILLLLGTRRSIVRA